MELVIQEVLLTVSSNSFLVMTMASFDELWIFLGDKLFHALLDSLPSPSQQGTAGSAAYDYVSPSSARATEVSYFHHSSI